MPGSTPDAKKQKGFAVWVVGLPGSGKSNLARALTQAFKGQGLDVVHLQMDERRKAYFPHPKYTSEEREAAYRMFAEEAADLTRRGKAVVMDGSAYKAQMREYARSLIPRFAEIYVRCTLESAMKREAKREQGLVMAGLYKKAIERKETGKPCPGLGQVIGVDVPFEENPRAELIIDNDHIPKEQTRELALEFLKGWLGQ
ncbi:MAG: adenylyl-sulfate kinase [Thermodesulfobacteriota bacterium]|nr:adenylyl-sulfate kinase [Thermodesulfobacteriota bacterium]